MILYYAVGGGLGHLVRARAVLHTLGLNREAAILTTSPYAGDPRIKGPVPVLTPPRYLHPDRRSWSQWLFHQMEQWRPTALYLDAFPAGLLGELSGWRPEIPIHYVARILCWKDYRETVTGDFPALASALIVEPLNSDHQAWITTQIPCVDSLIPIDPPEALTGVDHEARERFANKPHPRWLVVHSGPAEEVRQLISYAREIMESERSSASLTVITPVPTADLPPGADMLDLYPAQPFFPLADRVISAAGFNIMRQMEPYRDRHVFLPFPRRFDDQFRRAANARSIRKPIR